MGGLFLKNIISKKYCSWVTLYFFFGWSKDGLYNQIAKNHGSVFLELPKNIVVVFCVHDNFLWQSSLTKKQKKIIKCKNNSGNCSFLCWNHFSGKSKIGRDYFRQKNKNGTNFYFYFFWLIFNSKWREEDVLLLFSQLHPQCPTSNGWSGLKNSFARTTSPRWLWTSKSRVLACSVQIKRLVEYVRFLKQQCHLFIFIYLFFWIFGGLQSCGEEKIRDCMTFHFDFDFSKSSILHYNFLCKRYDSSCVVRERGGFAGPYHV